MSSILEMWSASMLLIILCICSLCISGSNGKVGLSTRISGGRETTSREHPYAVGIAEYWDDKSAAQLSGSLVFCTGCIVHERVVVTVAHCASQITTTTRIIVGATTKYDTDILAVPITRTLTHPDYDKDTAILADIALLYARDSLLKGFKGRVIPLATAADFHYHELVKIVGWGLISFNGTFTTHLMRGFMNTKECMFGDYGNPNQYFCLSSYTATSLSGDSGGPVVRQFGVDTLIGIIDGGFALSHEGKFDDDTLFERISDAVSIVFYRNWILANLPK